MLDVAIKYKEQLKYKFYNIWFQEKYKYYNSSCYYSDFELDDETWNNHQFVSLKNNNILGYISYDINRQTNNAYCLGIINFEEKPSITFSVDLRTVLTDIFEKFKFNKLSFYVVVGNPIEKSYDKLVKKYGGRIVGIEKKEVRLIDGNLYDKKLYEISRDSYITAKTKMRGVHR